MPDTIEEVVVAQRCPPRRRASASRVVEVRAPELSMQSREVDSDRVISTMLARNVRHLPVEANADWSA
jgi:hypothetical protein